ncbi:alpha/beta hydrolase [Nocardioides sp. NPDC023903]|uniref:alpha/beta hydrolase n=1 Tax=Nocardioides sp. NPDC023903 TaxID=3157195 RepID=UPI0033EE5DEC
MLNTFEYTITAAGPLSLDIHPAVGPASTDLGTVIYIHGGGFAVGDRATDATRIDALASHGLNVVTPDYRLAPGARFPDQVDDIVSTIMWVRDHLEIVGTTSPKIGLWGASAGAVLAALAALNAPAAQPRVEAVVSWFGFSDIATSASRSPLESAILPPGAENALLGVEDLASAPDLARQASPLEHVHADAPPFLIAHGDRDHVVEPSESIQLHQALTRAGAPSTLMLLGGAGHEDPRFDSADNIAITAAFLRSHLAGT